MCTLELTCDCCATAEWALHEVCQWENFDAVCPPSSVLVVDQATYGRRVSRPGRCIERAYDRTDCIADVRPLAARRCSGRRRCRIVVPGPDLDRSPHGCPRDLKANLEISYHCVAGNFNSLAAVTRVCHGENRANVIIWSLVVVEDYMLLVSV